MTDVLITVAMNLVAALVAVGFAGLIHASWVAKERLLARLAARMGVPYEVRQPWWVRWVNR